MFDLLGIYVICLLNLYDGGTTIESLKPSKNSTTFKTLFEKISSIIKRTNNNVPTINNTSFFFYTYDKHKMQLQVKLEIFSKYKLCFLFWFTEMGDLEAPKKAGAG